MNKHTPQEWADITGCYVARDRDSRVFDLYEEKPEINIKRGWWDDIGGNVGTLPYGAVDVDLDAHDWSTLYEPRKTKAEYVLLEEPGSDRLAAEVTRMLKDGWSLYGSPFISPGGRFGAFYYQAMTREKGYEQNV